MMTDHIANELIAAIRGLNGCLMDAAQEAADLRADLQGIAAKLAAILAIIGGAQ